MFPLRDPVRSRTFPLVNLALIGLNIVVFLLELSSGPQGLDRLLGTYALIPARLSWAQPLTGITLLTSAFLHGGWFHLLSNMWTLFIFGDNVEDRMGHMRYLIFYLLAGGALAGVFCFGLLLVTFSARRRSRRVTWPAEGFGPPYLE